MAISVHISDVGDRYKAALVKAVGGVPCGACENERKRLNGMTADQVRVEFDQIVEATVQRAKSSPRWWDRIRAKVGDAIAPDKLRQIISQCLEQAIRQSEEASKNTE